MIYHDTPLIAAIVAGLGLAFIFGTLASRLRIPPLAGYLLAGVLVGPNTPGFVADQNLAFQLAEIGITLLMFGVGLHFSLKDLLSVCSVAVPGALAQIAAATLLGIALSQILGWSYGEGLIFGLALSVASTAVLLRALQEQRLLETEGGRIAVGWLIVEDLVMVFVLVLLPAVALILGGKTDHPASAALANSHWSSLLLFTIIKVTAFSLIMFFIGRRLIPWTLHYVTQTGSRELFRLAVLAIALGVAFGAAQVFGISLALGAFFAGMIMRESELSQRAAEESLPFRDAFSVLFFVSAGMLFNPVSLLENTGLILAVLLIIIVGKSLVAFFIVLAFGYSVSTALMISASLAQIGEFSFILAEIGMSFNLLPKIGQDLILAGAILSILANPIFFLIIDRIQIYIGRKNALTLPSLTYKNSTPEKHKRPQQPSASSLTNHTILVGHGRIGRAVAAELKKSTQPFLVVEDNNKILMHLNEERIKTVEGNAANEIVFALTNPAKASLLILAIPNTFESGQIITRARAANPNISIIACAYSTAEYEHLKSLGADMIVLEETEIARGIIDKINKDRMLSATKRNKS